METNVPIDVGSGFTEGMSLADELRVVNANLIKRKAGTLYSDEDLFKHADIFFSNHITHSLWEAAATGATSHNLSTKEIIELAWEDKGMGEISGAGFLQAFMRYAESRGLNAEMVDEPADRPVTTGLASGSLMLSWEHPRR